MASRPRRATGGGHARDQRPAPAETAPPTETVGHRHDPSPWAVVPLRPNRPRDACPVGIG
jgi:hypothetical protein